MATGIDSGRRSQVSGLRSQEDPSRCSSLGFPDTCDLRPDTFSAPKSSPHSLAYNRGMANLTLVYGLRLLPSDEVAEVGAATIKLKNGREARIAMHILEGGKDEIEKQLKTSLAAFFDIYPEI